jgi:anti-sigma factor RsiW
MNPNSPITEADLHAYVDRQLTPEREREIESYLGSRPDEAQRVEAYRAQKRELRALFDPVLDEPLPRRVNRAALPRTPWYARRLAAGIAIALVGGATGWGLRGGLDGALGLDLARRQDAPPPVAAAGFAQRAAVAHAVFSPELRRAVEVDAAHEDQLVTWLSKRMGAPMKPPKLQSLGYALEGGRLLPGERGPVAQFMYRRDDTVDNSGAGGRLTLYVSTDIGDPPAAAAQPASGQPASTAFRFAKQGSVNVFYWVDGPFGYAISADAEFGELARVSSEVYRQLSVTR